MHVQPIIPPSQPVIPPSQPTTYAPSTTSNDDWGDFFSSRYERRVLNVLILKLKSMCVLVLDINIV